MLNDAFAGGGTYFADLQRALSPPVGHVVAFDGRALHGGEPIVRGTRYIIAAFLYVEDEDAATDGEVLQPARRGASALEGIFAAARGSKRGRGGDVAAEEDGAHAEQDSAGAGGFAFHFA